MIRVDTKKFLFQSAESVISLLQQFDLFGHSFIG